MLPNDYIEFLDRLSFLIKNKFIPMSRINDAVRRILRIKFIMGLFENPFADYSMTKYLGCQVCEDSLVLYIYHPRVGVVLTRFSAPTCLLLSGLVANY